MPHEHRIILAKICKRVPTPGACEIIPAGRFPLRRRGSSLDTLDAPQLGEVDEVGLPVSRILGRCAEFIEQCHKKFERFILR